jgi:hypothetical protein
VLVEEDLGVTSKEPVQHLLTGMAHTERDLADGCFERLVVAEAATSEGLLDGVVEVVCLELGHPAGTLTPDSKRAQDVPLLHASSEKDGEGLEHGQIFLTNVFI